MKRSYVRLFLAVIFTLALPLCALAADSGPSNYTAAGETRYLDYGFSTLPYEVSNESLTPDIVTVYYNTFTGVSPGTGTIRSTFTGAATTFCRDYEIKVYPAPQSVTVSETSMKLGVGETGHFTFTLSEGSVSRMSYSSSNPKLKVEESMGGVDVIASEALTANAIVSAFNGVSGACQVQAVPGPTGVSLSRETAKIFVGQTLQLSAEDTGGYSRRGPTFYSQSTQFCTVTADGLLVGQAAGQAAIVARTYNGHEKQCIVTVYDDPDVIDCSNIPSRIGLGEQIDFSPKDGGGNLLLLDLSLSDSSVLSMQYGRYLTGIKAGACTVTASALSKSATREITVCPAPESVVLSCASATLKEAETLDLDPRLPGGAAGSITFSTDNYSVARVSAKGVVTAVKPGTATITAYTYNSKHADCRVTVTSSEITYTLSPASAQVGIRKTLQLKLTDTNGNVVPAAYRSADENVATVDASTGLVTGVYLGTTTITATVADGREYTARIEGIAIPGAVTVNPTAMTLRVGQTGYFALDSDVCPYFSYSLASSNAQAVTVPTVAGGSLQAVGVGKATVTITAYGGKTAKIEVTVLPTENAIAPAAGDIMDLCMGQTKNMDVRDISGKPVACTYTSENSKAAKVDSKGNITGVSCYPSEHVRITAKAADGRTTSVYVRLYPSPGKLTLNATSAKLHPGETFQLSPKTEPATSIFAGVTYSTGSSKVATISKDGLVTAKAYGTCTVTARTFNGKTASAVITVGKAPASVAVSPQSLTLGVGETKSLKVTLTSGTFGTYFLLPADPSIAAVGDGDKVTGIAPGSTTLTVKTYNGLTAACTLTVRPAPGSLTLTCPYTEIGIKQAVQLNAALPSGTAGTVTYTSSNAKTASVDASGKVVGLRTGTVTITAAAYNGKKASVTLRVKTAPASVKLSPTAAKLCEGDTLNLRAILPGGSAGAYTFKTSSSKVASVSPSGAVTAMAPGKATVTVTTYNGRKAVCSVTVYKQPDSVTVKSSYTLALGRWFTLTPVFPSGSFSTVTFARDNKAVATVDSSGKVRGAGCGTAVITVTTANGKTAKCTVTVK